MGHPRRFKSGCSSMVECSFTKAVVVGSTPTARSRPFPLLRGVLPEANSSDVERLDANEEVACRIRKGLYRLVANRS